MDSLLSHHSSAIHPLHIPSQWLTDLMGSYRSLLNTCIVSFCTSTSSLIASWIAVRLTSQLVKGIVVVMFRCKRAESLVTNSFPYISDTDSNTSINGSSRKTNTPSFQPEISSGASTF